MSSDSGSWIAIVISCLLFTHSIAQQGELQGSAGRTSSRRGPGPEMNTREPSIYDFFEFPTSTQTSQLTSTKPRYIPTIHKQGIIKDEQEKERHKRQGRQLLRRACSTTRYWETLNNATDIYGNTVIVGQVEGIDQWFLVTRCEKYNTNTCYGFPRTRGSSSECRQVNGFQLAWVKPLGRPEFGWSYIMVPASCVCVVINKRSLKGSAGSTASRRRPDPEMNISEPSNFCRPNTTLDSKYGCFDWPQTLPGTTYFSDVTCANTTAKAGQPVAYRYCGLNTDYPNQYVGEWGPVEYLDCEYSSHPLPLDGQLNGNFSSMVVQ